MPVGGPIVGVSATLSPALAGSRREAIFSVGDPVVGTAIGWHAGHFHWTVGVTGFIPIGDYRSGSLANVANHRLAADVYGAATWFDPSVGLDLSAAMGVTFNRANQDTQYKTGDEFHLEWAATYKFTQQFSAGLVGYFYQQLTGDSGPGATLGPFKGRVTAAGGMVGYNFKLGHLPISTNVRVYREFDVENRLQGTAGFFTMSVPLSVQM